MITAPFTSLKSAVASDALQIYLLGQVDFEEALGLQRRLVYEIAGRSAPALILCEHSPVITVGRHGSRAHWFFDEVELRTRRWPIRWVNRGGGCWLQTPGQLAICPILPIRKMGLSISDYLSLLRQAIQDTLADFDITAVSLHGAHDLGVGDRPIACLGIAVRNWVTYYGALLNINPDLGWFQQIRTGKDHLPMTSLERERRGPVRPSRVRQRLLEHFAARFGFGQNLLFTEHTTLRRKAADAIVAAR